MNARALISQSAMVYCARRLMEIWPAARDLRISSCSFNIPHGLSAYKPEKRVVYCLKIR